MAGVLAANVISRLKTLYLTGELGLHGFRVKQCNIVNAGFADDEIVPGGVDVKTERGEGTYASNDNPIIVDGRNLLVSSRELGLFYGGMSVIFTIFEGCLQV